MLWQLDRGPLNTEIYMRKEIRQDHIIMWEKKTISNYDNKILFVLMIIIMTNDLKSNDLLLLDLSILTLMAKLGM